MGACHLVSMSGGKDSTAMALLALEYCVEPVSMAFCDTGHEHQQTYDYVAYLNDEFKSRFGVGIKTLKADLSHRVIGKRETVQTKWRKDGVSESIIESALEVLQPTGNPFLDLCLWKGRFPSPRRRFCTEELKELPLQRHSEALFEEHGTLISWQGVRADESPGRARLPELDVEVGTWDPEPKGWLIFRPILHWKAEQCFDMHKRHGINHNPLYEQGMGRVGCMPCINAGKAEMYEIARRFPEEVERVAEWERIVSRASKVGATVFMDARTVNRHLGRGELTNDDVADMSPESHGIHNYVSWAYTSRGGRQPDLIKMIEAEDIPQCQSIYGLCE